MLQLTETDDDRASGEDFQDIMQAVRPLLVTEQRVLLPLLDHSLDAGAIMGIQLLSAGHRGSDASMPLSEASHSVGTSGSSS